MNKLKEAIELKRNYNKMSFDDFIKEYEQFYNIKVDINIIDEFKMIGLNNTDFIEYYEDL